MPTDQQREAARLRKQRSRANNKPLELPLPEGTRAALDRVAAAAGFTDRREVLSMQIHKLDQLLQCDRHAFDQWVRFTVTLGDVSKYIERLHAAGVPSDE